MLKNIVFLLLVFASSSTLHAQINFIKVFPSSCEFNATATMWISIHSSVAEDYPDEYVLELENQTTGEYWEIVTALDFVIQIDNLSAGFYEITFRLPENCRIYAEKEVPAITTADLTLSASLTNPDCDASNGSIFLIATGGTAPYHYKWSDGVTHNGATSTRNFLSEGEYCVTVTDDGCGYGEGCYIILEPLLPDVEAEIVYLNDCNGNGVSSVCDGSISLTVTGADSYSVEWDGPNGFSASTEDIEGLCRSGEYTYSLDYDPDCDPSSGEVIMICCNSLPNPLQTTIDAEWDCNDNGSMSVVISGGVPPYEILWSTGETTEEISDLEEQVYSVTVTDLRGCRKIVEHNFAVIEILEENAACDGIFDGSIIIQINNPNEYPVDVSYDFSPCFDCFPFPLIIDETDDPIILHLNELAGNVEYTFHVWIDGCYIPFTFTLNEVEFDRDYEGFYEDGEDIYYCRYDLTCGETTIENGEVSLANIVLNDEDCDPGNPFSGCGSVEYYCYDNAQPIASKHVRRKSMRRLEAVLLAGALDLNEDAIAFHLAGNPCDRLTVCPNNPLCGSVSFLGEFGGQFAGYTDLGNGCTRVKCRLFGLFGAFNYTICGLDYIPDYIRPYVDDDPDYLERCLPVTRDFAAMVYFIPELIAIYGTDFTESSLYERLILYQNSPARYCARITYCANDFSFVATDINEVVCEIIDPPYNDGGYLIGATCVPESWSDEQGIYVWCHQDCVYGSCPPQPRFIPLDPSCCTLTSGDSIIPPRFISGMSGSTSFKSFAPLLQEEGKRSMNAIFTQGYTPLYHQLSLSRWISVPVDSLVYLFQNPKENSLLLVQKDSLNSAKFNMIAGDIEDPREFALSSNSSVSIDQIFSSHNTHFIHGRFNGSLSLAGSTIASSTPVVDYVLKTYLDGSLRHVNKIASSGAKKFLSEQFPGLFYAITSTNGSLTVNGGTSTVYVKGDIVEVNMNGSSPTVNKRLAVDTNFELLSFAYDSITNAKFYLLNGRGTITIGSQEVYSSSQNKLVLIATENNSYSWNRTFDNSVVKTDLLALEASDNGDVFVGFNLLDSLVIGDSTFTSAGGSDILLLGYDPDGQAFYGQLSGTEDDEIIKDIYYTEGLLYLGGDMKGETSERHIGDLDFVKFPINQNHAFVSVSLVDYSTPEEAIISGTADEEQLTNDMNSFVYPNPAKDKLFVRYDFRTTVEHIEIYSSFGQPMHVVRISETDGPINLDISKFPSGVYFLTITLNDGTRQSTTFVIND